MLFRSNVSLASLISQEKDQVDVNLLDRNNFNNNAYRNNFDSKNYKPYPPNNDNPYKNNFDNTSPYHGISNNRITEIEKSTKKIMAEQFEQNKVFSRQ